MRLCGWRTSRSNIPSRITRLSFRQKVPKRFRSTRASSKWTQTLSTRACKASAHMCSAKPKPEEEEEEEEEAVLAALLVTPVKIKIKFKARLFRACRLLPAAFLGVAAEDKPEARL